MSCKKREIKPESDQASRSNYQFTRKGLKNMLTTHGDAITKIYMGQTAWFLQKIKLKGRNKRK